MIIDPLYVQMQAKVAPTLTLDVRACLTTIGISLSCVWRRAAFLMLQHTMRGIGMDITVVLHHLHSGIRWIAMVITVVALAALIIGFVRKSAYTETTRRLMLAFSSGVGIQWVTGIVLFLAYGAFNVGYRWEHTTTMTLALVAAHLYLPFKRRPDQTRYIIGIAVIVVTLALIFVGVARLPYGWRAAPVFGG